MFRQTPVRITVVGVLLALVFAIGGANADILELRRFTLVDGTGSPARVVERLVIHDGVIVLIDENGNDPDPEPLEPRTRLDLGDAFVIPGLVDTHTHIARFPDTRVQATRILEQAVRGGVTTIRDLGGDARTLAELQRALASKEILGPTIVFSAIYGGPEVFDGGVIGQFETGQAPGVAPWARRVDVDSDIPRSVAETRGTGAAAIKLYGNLAPDTVSALIAHVHAQGMQAWAHATVFPTGPGQLVQAGVDALSHAPYLVWEGADEIPPDFGARISGPWKDVAPNHPRLQALYRAMAEHGVFLDATLYVYDQMQNFSPQVQAGWAREAFEWGAGATAEAHRLGVPITAGTDWFEPREGELPHTHDELVLLVKAAGLTPMAAIVAGTRNGAAAAGVLDERGTVEVGKAADLLILEADPLEDIGNTRKILRVIKDGRLIEVERGK